jgi:hypothetical protein
MAAFARPAVRVSVIAGAASAALGAGYYKTSFREAHAESAPSDAKASLKKVPWKGFTELKLESAEMVNHNVKRLTFALPDDDSVTGITPISKRQSATISKEGELTKPSSISAHTTYSGRCLDTRLPTIHASQCQW